MHGETIKIAVNMFAVSMSFLNTSVHIQSINRRSNLFHYYQISTQNDRYFGYNLRPHSELEPDVCSC